jgi:hypothetical protein
MGRNNRIQIKVYVTPEQHRALRLASASKGLPLAELMRQSALATANQEMAHFTPPTLTTEQPLRGGKRAARHDVSAASTKTQAGPQA